MKFLKIKNISLIFVLVVGCKFSVSAFAQSCSGGTTTVASNITSSQYISDANSCYTITPSGSLTDIPLLIVGDSYAPPTGMLIQNNGSITWNYTGNYSGIYSIAADDVSSFSLVNNGSIATTINGTNSVAQSIEIGSGVTIPSLTNAGSITASAVGTGTQAFGIYIDNRDANIINLTNTGSITASAVGTRTQAFGISIHNRDANIINLTNTGSITSSAASSFGIYNIGTITNLNNAQGGNSSSPSTTALTYSGNLPSNYNIIIQSPSSYGQLSVTSPIGATVFSIYAGGVSGASASVLSKGTYSRVLSGVAASNLTGAVKGNYSGLSWYLSETDVVNGIWDLLVGPSTADTQQSLVNTANALQNIFTLQNSVLANSFTYDCAVFDKNNICVSAGGRYTAVQSNGPNNTSALLIGAYRLSPNYRIGAYADQNLSVNNAGSGISLGNSTPLIGLFGVWNEKLDGTGTEVKVSAAYGQKNTTVTRQVVGLSEAGSGSSQLNSQGAQILGKYGFAVTDNVIVSPYLGMRYTQNNMGGYTEASSSAVTAPLTYSALNTNATTALAGVGVNYKVIPQAMLFASAGVESDMNTSNGTYSATGITGLTPINFNPNPVKTRATATLGAYYDIEKNHRVGITGIYRQEPFQSVSTTSVLATYTVGL